jgi:uncharacterized protein (TIGR03086 family)
MASFVLLPGAGSDGWYWHLVEPRLRAAGHEVVAVELPVDDDSAGLERYIDVATRAAASHDDVVVVGQSMAGFIAPVVAATVPVSLIVLVAAMTPAPGESMGEWWDATNQPAEAARFAVQEGRDPGAPFDPSEIFLHDVPTDVVAASVGHVREQSATPFADTWPLGAWPSLPTRSLIGGRDRLFPPALQRRLMAARLGITPDEIDTGHLPALARPAELAEYLLSCWDTAAAATSRPVAHRYHRVAGGFSRRVSWMTAADWDRPTPCEGWAARDVVRHLTEWVPQFLDSAGGPQLAVQPTVDDDPAGAWASLDRQLRSLLADAATATSWIDHPHVGRHSVEDAIGMFVLGDLLIHTWDLARTAGLDETLDADLVHDMLVGIEPMDEVLRTSGQYGPRINIPGDADEQTRLVAFTGRRP